MFGFMKPGVIQYFMGAFAALFFCVSAMPLQAAVDTKKHMVNFNENQLSVTADRVPLTDLLEEISDRASIEVFVSEDVQPDSVTVNIANRSLEDALKMILRGYNYAGIYQKTDDASWRMTSIKIYPAGRPGGMLRKLSGREKGAPVVRDHRTVTKTVIVSSGQDMITYGGIAGKDGVLVPSMTVPNPEIGVTDSVNKPWFALQKQLERKEFQKYQELRHMQRQVEQTQDPGRQETLALIYADEARKFYEMKQANHNKIEAMKRIEESRELTGQ